MGLLCERRRTPAFASRQRLGLFPKGVSGARLSRDGGAARRTAAGAAPATTRRSAASVVAMIAVAGPPCRAIPGKLDRRRRGPPGHRRRELSRSPAAAGRGAVARDAPPRRRSPEPGGRLQRGRPPSASARGGAVSLIGGPIDDAAAPRPGGLRAAGADRDMETPVGRALARAVLRLRHLEAACASGRRRQPLPRPRRAHGQGVRLEAAVSAPPPFSGCVRVWQQHH